MLSVLLSFIYIGFTVFCLGFGFRILIGKWFDYQLRSTVGIMMCGLGLAAVYAQGYSLFGGVGLKANLLLLLLCAMVLLFGRKALAEFAQEKRKQWGTGHYVLTAVLLLLMSYGASRGYLHFDTGLYHAQAIRWIEEYGVVPGLANLHCRLAYNSGAFPLTALYSFSFLGGRSGAWQSLHVVAGFLAFLSCFKGLEVVHVFRDKKVLLSDFIRVALLYYLSVIYTEMMSPSSDYFAMLFLFYIVLTWLELEEAKEKNMVPYSLLCVLMVVTVTIKLSAAIMVLLVLKPAAGLIKEKSWGQIGAFLTLGILAAAPFLIRNVILSGWLVYPFTGIDLFSVDWKIPMGEVQYDAEEIKVYAKGMTDVSLQNTPFKVWFPDWLSALKGLEKMWVLLSVISIPLGAGLLISGLQKKNKAQWGFLFLEAVFIVGYLFWQIGTPLIRYGYIYTLVFPLFTFGFYFLWLLRRRPETAGRIFTGVLLLFLLYKGWNLGQDILRYAAQNYYIWQQDYISGACEAYEMNGQTIYIPLENGQAGYDKFPSSPYERKDVELRGSSLREGFRHK